MNTLNKRERIIRGGQTSLKWAYSQFNQAAPEGGKAKVGVGVSEAADIRIIIIIQLKCYSPTQPLGVG